MSDENSDSRRLDKLISEFKQNRAAGTRPEISAFLQHVDDSHREVLLRLLVQIDIEYRLGLNQQIEATEYRPLGQIAFETAQQLLSDQRVLRVIRGSDRGRCITIDEAQMPFVVGRGSASQLKIDDKHISRVHLEITADADKTILRDMDSTSGTRVNGESVQAIELRHGDLISLGKTEIFFQHLTDEGTIEERAFGRDELKNFVFQEADLRLEVLAKMPQKIAESHSDEDLALRVVNLILEAIPDADAAAFAEYDVRREDDRLELNSEFPKTIRWNSRRVVQFRPSQRLVARSLKSEESILHAWQGQEVDSVYTMPEDLNWAFCIPIIYGEPFQAWCLYVSGKTNWVGSPLESKTLQGHMRFAELTAQFFASIHQVRMLQNRQAIMRQFFSPRVIETFADEDSAKVLQPKEGLISVLFCDVREFSRQLEQSAQHDLHSFLKRINVALSVMTQEVMRQQGVIADFQGDSILAFWGWPKALEDGPLSACRCALAIHKEFVEANRNVDHVLNGLHVGIGIGHGSAIAGSIGTQFQAKVGVFGPVVNLASRLESMTKQFQAPILLDEKAAKIVRKRLTVDEGRCRVLGRVIPRGMDATVEVSQLLPPAGEDSRITDAQIQQHESAVESFIKGNWSAAAKTFDDMPEHDHVSDLLMQYVKEHKGKPPSDWSGVIPLTRK